MTQNSEFHAPRQLTASIRYVGSSQKLARLRHAGFVAGARRFSGCVLRSTGPKGGVRFIACVRVSDESGDITGRDPSLAALVTTVIPSRSAAGWEAALNQAALAADALAERAYLAASGIH